jgi:glutaredoxin-like protein NrdH
MPVTVYTKPDCVQCEYTKKLLDRKMVPYNEINVAEHPVFAEQLRDKGIQTMPYVVTDNDEWTGFKLEKLRGLHPS